MHEYENLKLLKTRGQKIQKQLELNEKYRQQLEKEMAAEKQRLLADRSQKALAIFKDQLLERFEKGSTNNCTKPTAKSAPIGIKTVS